MRHHRFEPARLSLGLLMLGTALVYLMDALGRWRVPTVPMLLLVPASLLAAAFVAVLTFAVRRLLRRRRRARAGRGPGPVPGTMPMDELHGGYGRDAGQDSGDDAGQDAGRNRPPGDGDGEAEAPGTGTENEQGPK